MSPSSQTNKRKAEAVHSNDAYGHPENNVGSNARMMVAIVAIGVVAGVLMNRTLEDWLASTIVGAVVMLIIVALVGTGHSDRHHPPSMARHER